MKKSSVQHQLKSLGWILPILLTSLVYILDLRYFSSPPLRSDDWNWIVAPQIFNPLPLIDLSDRRPLISSLFALIGPIFGLKIYWYYLVNWLLLFLTGIVFYKVIEKAFPEHPWLPLSTALIFLIYPVNYARTWLIVANITLALLLALLVVLMMVLFSRSGKGTYLLLGNILFLVSLGIYEASFGNVLLAAVLLALFSREIPKKRRVLLSTFLLAGLGFFAWRTFIQPELIGVQDFYLSNVNLSISTVFSRYFQGGFLFLFNWFGPLFFAFKDYKYIAFTSVVILLVLIFLAFLPKLIKASRSNLKFHYAERIAQIKSLAGIAFVGLMFWVAGYIPIISVYQPTFYGDSSRVNYTSIPGAALALSAGMSSLITLIVKEKKQIHRILRIVLVICLFSGVILQIHSQNIRFHIWETKKTFWHDTFNLIPNIADDSIVVIVIPGFDTLQPFEMLPFIGDWEAASALQVLYNNPTLFAEYYYRDIGHPDNWVPAGSDYSRFLFLFFELETRSVRLIEDPASALSIPVEFAGYNPKQRIETYTPEAGVYRFLVH